MIIIVAMIAGVIFWLNTRFATVANCRSWPDWEVFKQTFISEGGRIVDAETPRQHTVSEGQAYALFFALVANDRPAFNRILNWTEANLANGDLTANLPAWQWGRRNDDSWGVLDNNSATDADLWLAYTLGEAGKLWHEQRYTALSHLIANRILRMEVIEAETLGPILLPGSMGFQLTEHSWRLNPSYLPLFLLRRLANDYPQSLWPGILKTSVRVIIESVSQGFAPDWVLYESTGKFSVDPTTHGIGSYDAIRVYLWAGMMPLKDPLREQLITRLSGMSRYLNDKGVPPEVVDSVSGNTTEIGPSGFSAALLPFMAAQNNPTAMQEQLQRIKARPIHDQPHAYYNHVLALFGQGWYSGYYNFAADGALVTRWNESCVALL